MALYKFDRSDQLAKNVKTHYFDVDRVGEGHKSELVNLGKKRMENLFFI